MSPAIWLAAGLIAGGLIALLLYARATPRTPAIMLQRAKNDAHLQADFDAKKKAEAERIDKESHDDLLRDLNGGPR